MRRLDTTQVLTCRDQETSVSSFLLVDMGRSSGKTASTFYPEAEFHVFQFVSRFSFGMRSKSNFTNSSGHVNSE